MTRLGAAALALALTATACGGDGDPPTSAATAASMGDDRVLTVLLADDWAPTDAVQRATADFEAEHPGVQVDLRGVPFGQLLETIVADREGPGLIDVAQGHAFSAGAQGHARPVTERFQAAFPPGTFIPGAVDDVTWDGEQYGVPLDVNAVALMVNTTALDELGFTTDDLATWESSRAIAEAAEGDVAFTYLAASTWSSYAWVRSNGADLFHFEDGEPVLTFDSPGMTATYEFIADLAEGGRLALTADDLDASDGFSLFRDGHLLTYATGTWDVANLLDDPPAFEWTVVPMPRGPDADTAHTVLGGSSTFITSLADDVGLAFEYAAHLVRPEYSLAYAMDEGRLPPQVDVLTDPFFHDPRYAAVVEELPNADAMKLIAFPRVQELYTLTIFDILSGDAGATAALLDLQAEAQTALVQDLADVAAAIDANG